MADWQQIEKDFIDYCTVNNPFWSYEEVVAWFKSRLESEYPPIEKLSEQEKNEFYVTNVTADIKANYGK
jgi:hypothetical protein